MTDAPRIAINGLGRIGRALLRAIIARDSFVDVVAVHDLTPAATLAYLLQHDTVHGRLGVPVAATDDELVVGDRRIKVLRANHPGNLPWGRWESTWWPSAAGTSPAGTGPAGICGPARNG